MHQVRCPRCGQSYWQGQRHVCPPQSRPQQPPAKAADPPVRRLADKLPAELWGLLCDHLHPHPAPHAGWCPDLGAGFCGVHGLAFGVGKRPVARPQTVGPSSSGPSTRSAPAVFNQSSSASSEMRQLRPTRRPGMRPRLSQSLTVSSDACNTSAACLTVRILAISVPSGPSWPAILYHKRQVLSG